MGWVSNTAAPLTPLGLGTKTGPGAPRWHQDSSYVPAQPWGLDAWLTATGIFPCPLSCCPPFRRVTVSEKATGCQDISIWRHRAPPPASPCVPRMERGRWLIPMSPHTRPLSEEPGWVNVSLFLGWPLGQEMAGDGSAEAARSILREANPSVEQPGKRWDSNISTSGRATAKETSAAFGICPSVFNITIPDPRHPPGGLRGPRLYAAHAGGRETDSSREAPVNQNPFHCVTSAERQKEGEAGAPRPRSLLRQPHGKAPDRDGEHLGRGCGMREAGRTMRCPTGGSGHMSKPPAFGDAARMGKPEAEERDVFLRE